MPLVSVPTEFLPESTDFETFALDAIDCAPARRGLEIWNQLRGSRRFPARADLTPRRIAEIMPYMSMATVIDGGADFENRFVGDAVVRAHNVSIVHRRFSDVARDMPVLMGGLMPLFRQVVAEGKPLAYRGRTGHDMTLVVYTDFEGLLLPLGERDDIVDHIVYVGCCSLKVERRK